MKLSRMVLATILVTVLLFVSVVPIAMAEEAQFTCRPTSATFSPVKGGTEKEGYYFLTVNLEFENGTANSYTLHDDVQCNLVFEDTFSAEGTFVDCEKNTIDPLMLIKGSVEFEVPNMLVESAGSGLMLEFVVGGEATQQSLSDVDYVPSQYEFDRYEFSYDDYTSGGSGANNNHSFGRDAYIVMTDKSTLEVFKGESSSIYHLKSTGKKNDDSSKYGKEYSIRYNDDSEEDEHNKAFIKDGSITIKEWKRNSNKKKEIYGITTYEPFNVYTIFTFVKGSPIWKASTKKASGGQTSSASPDKELVKQVQQKLNEAGFDCGTPDGIAGKKTKSAITAYQKDKGLEVTGTINDALLDSLGIKH